VTLASVRSLDAPKHLRTSAEVDDFEQELVDQFLLAESVNLIGTVLSRN